MNFEWIWGERLQPRKPWYHMTAEELQLRADISKYFKLSPSEVNTLIQDVEFVQYAAKAIRASRKTKKLLRELQEATDELCQLLEERKP